MKGIVSPVILSVAAAGFLLVLPATLQPAPAMESALVTVDRLSGVARGAGPGSRVSIDIIIGQRRLFQTNWQDWDRAEFGNRITFKTAKSMPIRFLVRLWIPGVKAMKSVDVPGPSRQGRGQGLSPPGQDDVLSTGFDGLVGDLDVGGDSMAARQVRDVPRVTTAGNRTDRNGVKGREIVLCETEIAWPPADGVHRLECGSATLEVSTKMLRRFRIRKADE